MSLSKKIVVSALVVGLALFAAGCKKKKATTPEDTAPPAPQAEAPKPPPEPAPAPKEVTEGFETPKVDTGSVPTPDQIADWNAQGVLKTVYFALDSYEIDDPARTVIQGNASWLQGHKQVGVRVEGHCDERGTIEYNLALGERRASAVREYLVNLGVDAQRIRIVSYGEEQPADPGHTEAAWAKNRRAVFVLESS